MWDPSIKPPSVKGRRRANADAWAGLPDVIRHANIAADNVDYRGNFTADIFEDLFETFAEILRNGTVQRTFIWMVPVITNGVWSKSRSTVHFHVDYRLSTFPL
jgi:hypothetical protein